MFESLNFLRKIILEEDYIYPGHAYLSPVGQTVSHVYNNNIYMNILDKHDFVKFRNRKNQNAILSFV